MTRPRRGAQRRARNQKMWACVEEGEKYIAAAYFHRSTAVQDRQYIKAMRRTTTKVIPVLVTEITGRRRKK